MDAARLVGGKGPALVVRRQSGTPPHEEFGLRFGRRVAIRRTGRVYPENNGFVGDDAELLSNRCCRCRRSAGGVHPTGRAFANGRTRCASVDTPTYGHRVDGIRCRQPLPEHGRWTRCRMPSCCPGESAVTVVVTAHWFRYRAVPVECPPEEENFFSPHFRAFQSLLRHFVSLPRCVNVANFVRPLCVERLQLLEPH